jgi:hypothetical protein
MHIANAPAQNSTKTTLIKNSFFPSPITTHPHVKRFTTRSAVSPEDLGDGKSLRRSLTAAMDAGRIYS